MPKRRHFIKKVLDIELEICDIDLSLEQHKGEPIIIQLNKFAQEDKVCKHLNEHYYWLYM
jgi:hypothetical protein